MKYVSAEQYAIERFEAELIRCHDTFGKAYSALSADSKILFKEIFIGTVVMVMRDIMEKKFIFSDENGIIKVNIIDEHDTTKKP